MNSQPRFFDATPWMRAGARLLLATCLAGPLLAQATMVRLSTSLGPIDIVLDDTAPISKANFLSYVNRGDYGSTFVHRKDLGVGIIQGGGYKWADGAAGGTSRVPAQAPIALEYSASRPNVRGSVAMARMQAQDSATSEWFVNLKDNTDVLGAGNGGGYAVFGRVTTPGLMRADAVGALRNLNCSSPFNTLPTLGATATCNTVNSQTLVMVYSARELPPSPRTVDRIFDYLEATYPEYTKTSGFVSVTDAELGYYYRYYAESDSYLGVKDGNLYYLVPAIDNNINLLGSVADFLAEAVGAGY